MERCESWMRLKAPCHEAAPANSTAREQFFWFNSLVQELAGLN